jgi:hypothetical protein
MTSFSPAHYEWLRGQIRGVLIAVESQLSRTVPNSVDELIDANECGEALELLTYDLAQSGQAIDPVLIDHIVQLYQTMQIDPEPATKLVPIAASGPPKVRGTGP